MIFIEPYIHLILTSALDIKINPRANTILELVRKFYSKITLCRCKHGYISFVPEFYLMKSPLGSILRKKKN
jgi:hypothetical protein